MIVEGWICFLPLLKFLYTIVCPLAHVRSNGINNNRVVDTESFESNWPETAFIISYSSLLGLEHYWTGQVLVGCG